MDRVNTALQLFLKHPDIKISDILDMTEELECEMTERGWILPTHCGKCGAELKFIDLSIPGSSQYTAKCDCKEGTGESKTKAVIKWIENV